MCVCACRSVFELEKTPSTKYTFSDFSSYFFSFVVEAEHATWFLSEGVFSGCSIVESGGLAAKTLLAV